MPHTQPSGRTGALPVALFFILPLFAALLTVAPASVLAAGNGSGTVEGHTVTGARSATPPALSADDQARLDAVEAQANPPAPVVPEGPGAKHLDTKPTIPPVADPPKTPPATTTNSVGKLSASDFSVFQNNAVTGGARGVLLTPSIAVHGDVVFITGNVFAALSTDRGNTWSYINPSTFFPTANGGLSGFGGGMEIIYDINHDVWVWELEYAKDTTGNTIRFATATTAQVVANTWKYYDFHATLVGRAATTDYISEPGIALSNNYVTYTGNFYPNAGGASTGSVALRISLADLHVQGNGVSYLYHDETLPGMMPTQGAATTMYLLFHVDTTTINLIAWPEANSAPNAAVAVAHASYNTGLYTCPPPSGTDTCAGDNSRIKTAWVANGVIGALWDVPQGMDGLGNFAFPYIQGVRVNAATLATINDVAMYASNVALAYPSVGVGGRGGLGTIFMFAGNGYYPGTAVAISDDFNGYAFPGDIAYVRYGTTSGLPYGHYLTARAADEYGNSWVGVTDTTQTGTTPAETRYVRWGRERDNPFFGKQALPAIWRSANAEWDLRNSLSGGFATVAFPFGAASDIPLMCAWKGDGQRYPVLWRPSTAQFIFGDRVAGPVNVGLVATFGSPSDLPLCGDWTGQGRETIGLFRPGTGQFFLSNSNTAPAVAVQANFGTTGDVPLVGDWDGNGTQTIGLYRPSTAEFFLSDSNTVLADYHYLVFGSGGDTPIVGDWDRNGTETVGIYRNGGWHYRNTLTTGGEDGAFVYGMTGDKPLVWR